MSTKANKIIKWNDRDVICKHYTNGDLQSYTSGLTIDEHSFLGVSDWFKLDVSDDVILQNALQKLTKNMLDVSNGVSIKFINRTIDFHHRRLNSALKKQKLAQWLVGKFLS